jgi:hypothetical protein
MPTGSISAKSTVLEEIPRILLELLAILSFSTDLNRQSFRILNQLKDAILSCKNHHFAKFISQSGKRSFQARGFWYDRILHLYLQLPNRKARQYLLKGRSSFEDIPQSS